VDVAIVLVKAYRTEAVAATLAAYLPDDAVALTLQNGLANIETLQAHLGGDRVLGGATTQGAAVLEAGAVRDTGAGITTLGAPSPAAAERVAPIAGALAAAGFAVSVADDVLAAIWTKAILNAAIDQENWTKESWTEPGKVSDLLAAFEGWAPQVRGVLEAVDETFVWALFDRKPMPRWSVGRVTPLGDACHPMLPSKAQGAAQAIEDRCVEQERLHGFRLAAHYLFRQIVHDIVVAAGEGGDEFTGVGPAAQRQGGEAQAGDPPLGSRMERAYVVL
jgi:hypothetical protein